MSKDRRRRPFLVFELHLQAGGESSAGPPGATGRPPVRYSMTTIGCYFARSGEKACKDAALAEDRLGYFVAVEATFPKIVFDTRNYSRKELKSFARGNPTMASEG
jgi:hypothetical protein